MITTSISDHTQSPRCDIGFENEFDFDYYHDVEKYKAKYDR